MPAYIHHQILTQVGDVFCGASLWQTPGFTLFSRKNSLRDLLERFPREVRGKNISRCFSHIILSLPQEALEDDEHLARGNRARELMQILQQKHHTDFGDLLDGDEIRYRIAADPRLAPDQVGVRFGHAVHVPGSDDVAQGKLRLSNDGRHWQALGPVYPGQRLILLAGDEPQSSLPVAGWPFAADTSILLINDGARLQLRPKGKLRCEFDAEQNCHVLQHERQRAFLKYDLIPTVRAASVWKPRPASLPSASFCTSAAPMPATHATAGKRGLAQARGSDDATALPQLKPSPVNHEQDLTWVPGERSSSRLSLVGLALPRLDGYQELGIQELEIGFNRQLQICAAAAAEISISVNQHNQIQVRNSRNQQTVALPTRFAPFQDEELDLAPCHATLQERYCATLRLPHPVCLALARGQQQLFGRGVRAFASLQLLDAPHFLRHHVDRPADHFADQAAPRNRQPASADQLGLSRRACRIEAGMDGLRVTREAPNQALYHLDAQWQLVSSMEPDATPYLIPDGHHLVAGNYVLRFDA